MNSEYGTRGTCCMPWLGRKLLISSNTPKPINTRLMIPNRLFG